MAYRDDLEAALARVAALEAECARLRGRERTPVADKTPSIAAFVRLPIRRLAIVAGGAALIAAVGFMLVMFTACAGYYLTDGVCGSHDRWCTCVRDLPSCAHELSVASPAIVTVALILITSWQDAKKKRSR